MKVLREVMPSVSRNGGAALRDLVAQLAIHPKEIGERPSMPVMAGSQSGIDTGHISGDEAASEDDDEGLLSAFAAAELSHVDSSNVRITDGLLPFDGACHYPYESREVPYSAQRDN